MPKIHQEDLKIIARIVAGEDVQCFSSKDDDMFRNIEWIRHTENTKRVQSSVKKILFISDAELYHRCRLHFSFDFIVAFTKEKPTKLQLTQKKKFSFINNPDGSMRWIYPSSLFQPSFLSCYNSGTLKGAIIKTGIQAAFSLGLKRFIANGNFTVYSNESLACELPMKNKSAKNFSVFTGTTGINRKILVEYNKGGKTKFFAKIPIGKNAHHLVNNEAEALKSLSSKKFETLYAPSVRHENKTVLIENIKPFITNNAVSFTNKHTQALDEMYEATVTNEPIEGTSFDDSIKNNLYLARQNKFKARQRGIHGIIEKLIRLNQCIDKQKRIPVAMAHGDFTPWNMYVNQGHVFVYDWEFCKREAPLLFDLFHFVFQSEVMLRNSSYEKIEKEINRALELPAVKTLIAKYKVDVELHYKLYLLMNISYYVNVYMQQDLLHKQAGWLLTAWQSALSKYTLEQSLESNRKSFVREFFSSLTGKKYVVLKHRNESIEDLPEFSDLDLLITKTDLNKIIHLAEKHILVSKSKVRNKSFMSTIELFFKDGSYLSIDLIHAFHRKELQYLDARKMLTAQSLTFERIQVPEARFCFEYTWLFYLLNGASVPVRYVDYYLSLNSEEKQKVLNHINTSFRMKETSLENLCKYNHLSHSRVKSVLNLKKQNSFYAKLKRKGSYIIDSLKDVVNHKGLVITFTGVDGAGKSTIIEEVKNIVSDKFRRKVVVIRHRPSLLPILSEYKYGKEGAQKKVLQQLPRTGKNDSKISSFFRFSYYYTDYLLGQFYIFAKYIMRGYVVLYDRYYFDFIIDGKRSNITLNKGFIKALYHLIYHPQINVLLYAPAEKILQRKKELDQKSIEELTNGYRNLFADLSERDKSHTYLALENIDKTATLERIVTSIVSAA